TQNSRSIGGIVGYCVNGEIIDCVIFASTIRNIGKDGYTNGLPYMGMIVGLISGSKVWYVATGEDIILDTGYLDSSQTLYVGSTRYWPWGGYEGPDVDIA
ncbi:MAG: hypothetical protein LBU60_03515, partial [Clostridiales bacterium]|nr:hypothetical protein [Clostridiales bacterium]